MAEAADVKKRRNANFSANDCLLLANIMGQSSNLNKTLTNYQYVRHKFNSSITSSTKKINWTKITENFITVAEVPRKTEDIVKKWDNLVQTHRLKYQDFQREQSATGGGPQPGKMSAITEAVMDVIGRNSVNTVGIPGSTNYDSSLMMLERLTQKTTDNTKTTEDIDIITEIMLSDHDSEVDLVGLKTSKRSLPSTSTSCTKCQCLDCSSMRQLKRKKLELQIQYFSKIEQ
ncbi:uncharacterized protein LOC132731776 [Ruditapes philippinarum]|uniref:uncharacterized protein LOC132731776 n=1 Tax=Ruditapes philippinarum TaxID=129788 RepID=UPI00295B4C23|nr:uncharacterized protein LOC132731776 [Ruditapes philippinarum]